MLRPLMYAHNYINMHASKDGQPENIIPLAPWAEAKLMVTRSQKAVAR